MKSWESDQNYKILPRNSRKNSHEKKTCLGFGGRFQTDFYKRDNHREFQSCQFEKNRERGKPRLLASKTLKTNQNKLLNKVKKLLKIKVILMMVES